MKERPWINSTGKSTITKWIEEKTCRFCDEIANLLIEMLEHIWN